MASIKTLAPGGDDRSAALFGFDKKIGVGFGDDNASAAVTGLEKTLALVGDTASAGDIDFEPFQAVTSPAPKTWTSRGKKTGL